MIPIKQSTFGEYKGNCFQAALASILELPLDKVPNFCCDYSADEWYFKVINWLEHFGLGIMPLLCDPEVNNDEGNFPRGLHLMSGPSERLNKKGDQINHTVVARNGKMIHDPHPDNTGIEKIMDIDILYALDPAIAAVKEQK